MSGVERHTIQAAFTGSVAEPTEIVLAADFDRVQAERDKLAKAMQLVNGRLGIFIEDDAHMQVHSLEALKGIIDRALQECGLPVE